MKRSEMIGVMIQGSRDYNPTSPINLHQANIILEFMEKAGMVPPIIQEKSWLIADPDTGEMTYAVHEWEPEACPLTAKIFETWRPG
jgi:hypothetical protein